MNDHAYNMIVPIMHLYDETINALLFVVDKPVKMIKLKLF